MELTYGILKQKLHWQGPFVQVPIVIQVSPEKGTLFLFTWVYVHISKLHGSFLASSDLVFC